MKISRFGLFASLAFVLLSAIFRIILPFGDEPDFGVKAYKLIYGDDFNAISLLLDGKHRDFNLDVDCKIDATPFSILPSIKGNRCQEYFSQILLRTVSMVIAAFPILFIFVFRKQVLNIIYKRNETKDKDLASLRIDGALSAIVFPGFIYYIGLLSNEQITLMISVVAFLFIDKKIFVALLLLVMLFLDFGNAIVACVFFLTYFLVQFIKPIVGRMGLYAIVFASIAIAYGMGLEMLSLIPGDLGLLSSKADSINHVLTEGSQADRIEKYPIVFRPLLTLASFVLYTPAYVKPLLTYIGVFGFLVYIMQKKPFDKLIFMNSASVVENYFISFLVCVFLFTLALPTYANGKYYIFMLPVLFCLALIKSKRNHVVLFSILMSLLTALQLFVFRTI